RGDADLCLLWMTRSLKLAPPGATELHTAIRAGLGAWGRQVHSVRMILPTEGTAEAVAIAPDGTLLTAGRRKKNLANQGWNDDTGQVVKQLLIPTVPGLNEDESGFAFSPQGDRILLQEGDANNPRLRLIDLATGKQVWETNSSPGTVATRAVFSPNGKVVLVGYSVGRDVTVAAKGQAQLLDSTSGKPLCPAIDHARPVFALAFHPDGKSFVTECGLWADGTQRTEARFWDLNGRQIREPLKHPCMVHSIAY